MPLAPSSHCCSCCCLSECFPGERSGFRRSTLWENATVLPSADARAFAAFAAALPATRAHASAAAAVQLAAAAAAAGVAAAASPCHAQLSLQRHGKGTHAHSC
ncbi:uncharacterized protein LOC113146622 [Cyclospora cayetanensis]|uniref:Uncharacterized protein LOC113146622 n=1 Tax=Cyclospora cayetanensis TaxID=88456 RepID=A0A6P6RRB5_9EIME|nr:uncharacterized protein LOC113146622 [Cyclospora cayetanensis]